MKRIIFLWLMLSSSNLLLGQESYEIDDSNPSKKNYIQIGTGLVQSSFIDRTTSPLKYTGTVPMIHLALSKSKQNRDSEIGFSYQWGNHGNSFNDQNHQAYVNSISIHYSRLYPIMASSKKSWKTALGGKVQLTTNYRDNEGLMNYGLAYEVIPTLFLSAKTGIDFQLPILFKKKHKTAIQRNMSYQLNIGVLNNAIRSDLPILFDAFLTNNGTDLIGSTQSSFFAGYRFSSSLDYTVRLRNKNAIQCSYIWDALATGRDGQQLEMATHTIRCTLFFKTNHQ